MMPIDSVWNVFVTTRHVQPADPAIMRLQYLIKSEFAPLSLWLLYNDHNLDSEVNEYC
jgi:hypothetical protein